MYFYVIGFYCIVTILLHINMLYSSEYIQLNVIKKYCVPFRCGCLLLFNLQPLTIFQLMRFYVPFSSFRFGFSAFVWDRPCVICVESIIIDSIEKKTQIFSRWRSFLFLLKCFPLRKKFWYWNSPIKQDEWITHNVKFWYFEINDICPMTANGTSYANNQKLLLDL